jgi:hypothetical protein
MNILLILNIYLNSKKKLIYTIYIYLLLIKIKILLKKKKKNYKYIRSFYLAISNINYLNFLTISNNLLKLK